MKDLQLDVDEIVGRQAEWTAQWHEADTPPLTGAPWAAIERNHRMNFQVWHEEDVARRDDLGAERVRQAKRAIDRCNQARNDAMEQIDDWLLGRWPAAAGARPLHSETPGMIIDRLSILSLKLHHTRIEAERVSASEAHRARCRERCRILEEQTADLAQCLKLLLEQLRAGERGFKLYRQLKMYNDASLNPQLYAAPSWKGAGPEGRGAGGKKTRSPRKLRKEGSRADVAADVSRRILPGRSHDSCAD